LFLGKFLNCEIRSTIPRARGLAWIKHRPSKLVLKEENIEKRIETAEKIHQEEKIEKLFNFSEDKVDFFKWLTEWSGKVRIYGKAIKKTAIKKETARDYVNKLEKVLNSHDVYTLADFEEIFENGVVSGELQKGWNNWAKGLRNYMYFLYQRKRITPELVYEIIDAFAEIKPTGTRDIDLKNEEIREAYNHIKQYGNELDLILYKLLVFSGLRLAHILEALHTWNPDNLRIQGKVAAYDMEAFIRGTKKAFLMLFPAEMADEVDRFPESYTYEVAKKRINYKRVSAITIRHWHYNFMILENKVPEGIANFIQGRSPENVGSAHYLAKKRGAIEEYARIVDKFPIPP